tara:strand:+ start:7261 stop:7512 length:252 start_codon:yes stop_codon:yes gene_type:complete
MENELTQQEIQFIKNFYKEQKDLGASGITNKRIEEARSLVGEKHKERLEKVKDNPKLRKQIIEEITVEANIAEQKVKGLLDFL